MGYPLKDSSHCETTTCAGTRRNACGVEVAEEGLACLDGLVHPGDGCIRKFIIDGLHTLNGQGTRVLDLAVGVGVDDAARSEALVECGILGIVRILRLFFGIEVAELAAVFVEAVVGGQHFVTVAEMVLAELPGGEALSLEDLGYGRVLRLEAFRRA